MTSPLMIEIALHYYSRVDQYGGYGGCRPPAVQECLSELVQRGLLERTAPDAYRKTTGLDIWVQALCAVPFPVQEWRFPAPPSRDD